MKPYYYVYRVGNRAPTVRHATPALAAAEAERLAAQHPGDTFEVLQCLAVTRTTTPVTEWLDGCGPSQVAAAEPEPQAHLTPPPPELGYIEITDPEEILREGDQGQGRLNNPDRVVWGDIGTLVGRRAGAFPQIRFRRPDPTRQVVPIPEEYLPLPPLPEGKTQWVGRGRFAGERYDAGDRDVRFCWMTNTAWISTDRFSGDLLHIEAV